MTHLHNSNPVPPGLRYCYWDPRYIASQSFCITTKLTDKEAKQMADYEEQRLFENLDIIKKELQAEMQNEAVEVSRKAQLDGSFLDVKKVVSDYMAGPKKFYFIGGQKAKKRFGACYTQTNAGRPAKIAINRSDFLRR